jgi:hypothetical protein
MRAGALVKFTVLGLFLGLSSCGHKNEKSPFRESNSHSRQSLVVMNYDASNESEELTRKNLLAAINEAGEGLGPDVLVLQGIDDAGFVNEMYKKDLKAFAYNQIAVSNFDKPDSEKSQKKSVVLSRFAFEEKNNDDCLELNISLSAYKKLHAFVLQKDDVLSFIDDLPQPQNGESYLVTGIGAAKLAVSNNAKMHRLPLASTLKGSGQSPLVTEILLF